MIQTGQRLQVPNSHKVKPWLMHAALTAIPAPPPPPPPAPAPAPAPAAVPASSTTDTPTTTPPAHPTATNSGASRSFHTRRIPAACRRDSPPGPPAPPPPP